MSEELVDIKLIKELYERGRKMEDMGKIKMIGKREILERKSHGKEKIFKKKNIKDIRKKNQDRYIHGKGNLWEKVLRRCLKNERKI